MKTGCYDTKFIQMVEAQQQYGRGQSFGNMYQKQEKKKGSTLILMIFSRS